MMFLVKVALAGVVLLPPAKPNFHQPTTPSKKYTWYLGEDGKAHKCAGKRRIAGRIEGDRVVDIHVEVDGCVNELAPVRLAQ